MTIDQLSEIVQKQNDIIEQLTNGHKDLTEANLTCLYQLNAILEDYSQVVESLTGVSQKDVTKRVIDRSQQIRNSRSGSLG